MELGAIINIQKNLGSNTTSSTETEIVSNGEILSKCAWFRCFILAQGDDLKIDSLL